MSQQYGPPPNSAPGGWGRGPSGPQRQSSGSMRSRWIIMGGTIVAVALIAVGVVVLVTGGDKETPVSEQTPDPTGTLYTPPTPSPTKAAVTKGRYDTGVEIGGGLWFTPVKGWLPDWDKSKGGTNYILQQPGARGRIDGYYWVRQTTQYDAKGFAEHLVDVESDGFKDVRIGKTVACKTTNPAIKACYAVTFNALVPAAAGKFLPFRGFVTAYADQSGKITATDAALELSVYKRRVRELVYMNNTLMKSF
jgi:hypothetical protein